MASDQPEENQHQTHCSVSGLAGAGGAAVRSGSVAAIVPLQGKVGS